MAATASEPTITARTIAVSSAVGAPFELISANPPPTTSAARAKRPKRSEAWRAALQKNRDCDRSGPDPFATGPLRPLTSDSYDWRPPRRGAHRRARPGSARNRRHWGWGTAVHGRIGLPGRRDGLA